MPATTTSSPMQCCFPWVSSCPSCKNCGSISLNTKATADCLVDVLGLFWQENRHRFPQVQRLVLNQDNGPENNSRRTQFMQRIVQFADQAQLDIGLAYYPPYHSKYNPVERCWGVLENHWRGEILDTLQAAVTFARDMTWCTKNPVVRVITTVYETGKSIAKKAMAQLEATRLQRDPKLGRWFVDISHHPAT